MLTSDLKDQKTPGDSQGTDKKKKRLKKISSKPLGRRDFLTMTTCAVGAVGACGVLWPFVESMNPAADVAALATIDVDLSTVPEGQGVTLLWRGTPIFVRHRTAAEIREAETTKLAQLMDPESDAARVKAGHTKWLVVVGVCTHLGCVPTGQKSSQPRGKYGGWLCPCHGSEYDTSGRVRRGPAPSNLPIPPYVFLDEKTIRIGQSEA